MPTSTGRHVGWWGTKQTNSFVTLMSAIDPPMGPFLGTASYRSIT